MYPFHRPPLASSRAPPLPQSSRPPPRNLYPQHDPYPQQDSYRQTIDDFDDEWSDCSDDGQDPSYTTASYPQRMGTEPQRHWEPPPTVPVSRTSRTLPDNRPPPVPRKDPAEPADMYLQFDPDLEQAEIGNGYLMDRPPPPHMPNPLGNRPPMAPPQRPPKPSEPQDVYMAETGPTRPPPQPPVKSPNPSPNSSFNLRRQNQASTDSGFGESMSRSNSGNAHRPSRHGSNESWSSGGDSEEAKPPPGIPKINAPLKFPKPFSKGSALPPMPQIPSSSLPRQPPTSQPTASASAVKELSDMLASRPQGFATGLSSRKDFPHHKMPPTDSSPSKPPFSPTGGHQATRQEVPPPSPRRRTSNAPPMTRGNKVVEDQPWYANVSRDIAEQRISQANREGCFLVRLGRGADNPYTITAYGNHKCYNLRIRKRDDDKYALGTPKPNERAFPTVCDIIEYFTSSPLVLAQGEGSVTLCGPP